jgi:hypothetical protein
MVMLKFKKLNFQLNSEHGLQKNGNPGQVASASPSGALAAILFTLGSKSNMPGD